MQTTPGFRHELKFVINRADYMAIKQRIAPVMARDPHAGKNGIYTVRSIYFDNYNDRALREKIDGVAHREKFRIRYYDDDLSFISLEKKIKHNDLCLKLQSPLPLADFRAIATDPAAWSPDCPAPLVRELAIKMKTRQLRPRVLVSYTREAFVYAAGNVRVTFDSNIRTSLFATDFADGAPPDISAADSPGDIVLEVKYDEFLPDIIQCLLQCEGLRQQAFSKYGACRRFG